jgi:DNA-directed RNA polymerase specialized sigma24 family protein
MSFPPDNSAFSPTRWTLVVQAQGRTPEARAALSDLCAAYYAPVQEFIRQWLRGADRADDLAQEFFAQLLDRGGVDGADRERGRFRSFLLGAVKHFLSHARDRDMTAKRGGGMEFQPLDAASDAIADPALPPDAAFDRQTEKRRPFRFSSRGSPAMPISRRPARRALSG